MNGIYTDFEDSSGNVSEPMGMYIYNGSLTNNGIITAYTDTAAEEAINFPNNMTNNSAINAEAGFLGLVVGDTPVTTTNATNIFNDGKKCQLV